jgi:hypothetical protein
MLPAELVEVRLVPGVDATTRSLAAAGVGVVLVLSAMAAGVQEMLPYYLLVAETKLHRAWSYQV